jgi:hypothetical protein
MPRRGQRRQRPLLLRRSESSHLRTGVLAPTWCTPLAIPAPVLQRVDKHLAVIAQESVPKRRLSSVALCLCLAPERFPTVRRSTQGAKHASAAPEVGEQHGVADQFNLDAEVCRCLLPTPLNASPPPRCCNCCSGSRSLARCVPADSPSGRRTRRARSPPAANSRVTMPLGTRISLRAEHATLA